MPDETLLHELRQSRPFPTRGAEALVALLRTADVLRQRLAIVLAPHEVTVQQYNVLRILRGASPERLPTLEIANRTIERSPGITRLLDRLEAKGLVHRERCPHDRRQVLCAITSQGLALLARLDAPVAAADEELVAGLGVEDLDRLVALLRHIRGAGPH